MNKINLCIMSMELIFVLVFIKSVEIPIYLGMDYEFIGWQKVGELFLLPRNIIAVLCIVGFLWSEIMFLYFKYWIKGSPDSISIEIDSIKNNNVEYLSLLGSIIAIVRFDFGNTRDLWMFAIIFVLYCVISVNAELYVRNPLLRYRGVHLYTGKTSFLSQENPIFLSLNELQYKTERQYKQISRSVYWIY